MAISDAEKDDQHEIFGYHLALDKPKYQEGIVQSLCSTES